MREECDRGSIGVRIMYRQACSEGTVGLWIIYIQPGDGSMNSENICSVLTDNQKCNAST